MVPGVIAGRGRPLALLAEAAGAARAGQGGLLLVSGEPGIGKTALLTAAAADAAIRGMTVLAATCWEGDGVPGYWPWVQLVRALQQAAGPDRWPALRQAAGEGLARLLGEVPAAPPASHGEEFQLLDAVTTLLTTAARQQPLLVMIDDLHWADPASLRMLDFAAGQARLAPMLFLAAFRDAGPQAAGDPLLPKLAARATTLPLAGLDEAAAGELVAAAGVAASTQDIAEVHRRTGGNPFFIEQTAWLWSATGTAGGIAPGVRAVVQRRLGRLPVDCTGLLVTAAVLGREFDLAVLAGAAGLTAAETARRLAPAAAAGLISECAPGTSRFVHDLVRETLRESLDRDASRKLRAAVVRAVTGPGTLAARMLPAELAGHAYLAVPETAPAAAVRHLLAAAQDAAIRNAPEEACRHCRRALEVISEHRLPGGTAVTCQLGTHQHRAGELDAARRTFTSVVSAARDSGDPEAFAQGVLGLHGLGRLMGDDPASAAALADEARSQLAAAPGHQDGSALLARVMAAASQARSHELGADRDAAARASAAAVAMARRCGDPAALGFCLLAQHDAIWRPGTTAQRLAIAGEMAAAARRTDDRELELQASLLRMVALLEAGDPAGLAEHRRFTLLAEQARLPRFRYLALSRQAAIAALQGRFSDARRHLGDARALGVQIGEVDASSVWHDQLWEVAWLEGRDEEIDDLIAADRAQGDPLALALETVRALDAEDAGQALAHRAELEALGERWPQWAGLLWLTIRAQVAAAAADPALRAAVREAISPLRDQWAVLGGAVIVHGPMAYWDSVTLLGQHHWDEAISGFALAGDLASRLQAKPWSVLAQLGAAQALLGRGAPGDADAAAALLSAAGPGAAALGMRRAASRAAALLAGGNITARAQPRPDPAGNVFRFDGELWTLSFGGRTTLMPDAKGLHDLHALLSQPGTDIPVTALLSPAGGEVAAAAWHSGAGPVLDDRAKAEYRARLTALDEGIDGALERQDDERAARLEAERTALIGELRRATGLGGRDRRLGDTTERARKTVTARIRDILRRLDQRHPELASHLRATVSTGTYCRYQPGGGASWDT